MLTGHSEKWKVLQAEHLERLRSEFAGRAANFMRKVRASQAESSMKYRSFDGKQKKLEEAEEMRRQAILTIRKAELRDATERYQRATTPRSTRRPITSAGRMRPSSAPTVPSRGRELGGEISYAVTTSLATGGWFAAPVADEASRSFQQKYGSLHTHQLQQQRHLGSSTLEMSSVDADASDSVVMATAVLHNSGDRVHSAAEPQDRQPLNWASMSGSRKAAQSTTILDSNHGNAKDAVTAAVIARSHSSRPASAGASTCLRTVSHQEQAHASATSFRAAKPRFEPEMSKACNGYHIVDDQPDGASDRVCYAWSGTEHCPQSAYTVPSRNEAVPKTALPSSRSWQAPTLSAALGSLLDSQAAYQNHISDSSKTASIPFSAASRVTELGIDHFRLSASSSEQTPECLGSSNGVPSTVRSGPVDASSLKTSLPATLFTFSPAPPAGRPASFRRRPASADDALMRRPPVLPLSRDDQNVCIDTSDKGAMSSVSLFYVKSRTESMPKQDVVEPPAASSAQALQKGTVLNGGNLSITRTVLTACNSESRIDVTSSKTIAPKFDVPTVSSAAAMPSIFHELEIDPPDKVPEVIGQDLSKSLRGILKRSATYLEMPESLVQLGSQRDSNKLRRASSVEDTVGSKAIGKKSVRFSGFEDEGSDGGDLLAADFKLALPVSGSKDLASRLQSVYGDTLYESQPNTSLVGPSSVVTGTRFSVGTNEDAVHSPEFGVTATDGADPVLRGWQTPTRPLLQQREQQPRVALAAALPVVASQSGWPASGLAGPMQDGVSSCLLPSTRASSSGARTALVPSPSSFLPAEEQRLLRSLEVLKERLKITEAT